MKNFFDRAFKRLQDNDLSKESWILDILNVEAHITEYLREKGYHYEMDEDEFYLFFQKSDETKLLEVRRRLDLIKNDKKIWSYRKYCLFKICF